jgi:hypothetical protein
VKPKAWSHTALDTFENCPRQYHEVKVLNAHPFVETKEVLWGREVHKAFENYLVHGTPLPPDLLTHEPFLAAFKAQPGALAGEERLALDTKLRECAYFGPDVWYRGQVDARKRTETFSHILDHKTGKVKSDFSQLKGFAMWEFLTQPAITDVKVEFYWTQLKGANGETYRREQLPDLLRHFVPALTRYADAFITDTWTPKQSGLCAGWCPVTACEFWRPMRKRS